MNRTSKSQQRAGIGSDSSVSTRYETIKLGIDWHAHQYCVVRIIDGAGPEPAQRFHPEAFLQWVKKQLARAEQVSSCYEAGAGGFVLHRQLRALGATNYVIAPRPLDRSKSGVQNDPRDARELAQDLDRFVRGNKKALRLVRVPTPEQEQLRAQSRQRGQLQRHRLSLAAQGRSLLLNQGWRESNRWWKAARFAALRAQLPRRLVEALEGFAPADSGRGRGDRSGAKSDRSQRAGTAAQGAGRADL